MKSEWADTSVSQGAQKTASKTPEASSKIFKTFFENLRKTNPDDTLISDSSLQSYETIHFFVYSAPFVMAPYELIHVDICNAFVY